MRYCACPAFVPDRLRKACLALAYRCSKQQSELAATSETNATQSVIALMIYSAGIRHFSEHIGAETEP